MKPITYIKEVRKEMKHVSWPNRQQAVTLTVITIVISLLVAAYLGLLDKIFVEAISLVI